MRALFLTHNYPRFQGDPVGSFVLLKIVDVACGLRVTEADEYDGLDITQHGERGYNLEEEFGGTVVDTTGRAEVATLKGLRYTDRAFLEAVRQALPRMRFKPAEIRGRRVRQLVQQAFAFEVGPGAPSMQPRGETWPPRRTRPPR